MHIGLNAHLLSSQAGYRSAGIHNHIYQLLKGLPSVAPEDWRFSAMVGKANSSQFDPIRMKRAPWDTESALRRIVWEQALQPMQLGEYDLYHAMAFVAPMLLSKPMVVTVYDLTFMRYPERLSTARRLYLRLLTGITCRRAKRVLAISESTGHDLVELLGIDADKIDVTPLGYDEQVYRVISADEVEAFRVQQGLPERFWLFVGTIEPRKNLKMLIQAYAQLPRSERLPLFLAGGKGWLTDDLFQLVDTLSLQEEVHFTGFLPFDEIPLWYNSAECFVYPSVFEGFGLPVLEAMACGTPVITSDVSSLPEVAEGAGMCISPHDVEAWSEALRKVYHDPDWRVFASEQGLRKATQFHWRRTNELTIKSYQRALEL